MRRLLYWELRPAHSVSLVLLLRYVVFLGPAVALLSPDFLTRLIPPEQVGQLLPRRLVLLLLFVISFLGS